MGEVVESQNRQKAILRGFTMADRAYKKGDTKLCFIPMTVHLDSKNQDGQSDEKIEKNFIENTYIVMTGFKDCQSGGEYLFLMTYSSGFPQSPPKISCLTPQNCYDHKSKTICIDGSIYHAQNYKKSAGSFGFASQIWALQDARYDKDETGKYIYDYSKGTIGYIDASKVSDERAKLLAEESKKYNRNKYPEIMKAYDEYISNIPKL